MADAREGFNLQIGAEACDALADLLYADDTLLIGTSAHNCSTFPGAVARHGAGYGLSLNLSKTL